MSWKSLVCAGLLCALAMPVTAAPTVSVDLVTSGGKPVLTASGDWQWQVSITPDATDVGTGNGSVAEELAFILTGADLLSVDTSNTGIGNDWDHDLNPGNAPSGFGDFSWLTTVEGVQSDLTADEVYAAMGSIGFTTADPSTLITIIADGPNTTASLSTGIEWGGAYASNGDLGGTNGRVAQNSVNYNDYAGTASATVLAGNANFDSAVNGLDFGILAASWQQSGKIWTTADFNGDGTVDGLDFGILAAQWQATDPNWGPGAGAIVSVPEPTSVVLLALAGVALGWISRRRSA